MLNATYLVEAHGQTNSTTPLPDDLKIKTATHINTYLLNGELTSWNGPRESVYTQVGDDRKLLIGTYPKLGVKESLEILDAAVKAYNNGLGEWANTTIDERVQTIQLLLSELIKEKKNIVKLLIWEIGKSITDANKEFDRTIEYMQGTIKFALKNNSREEKHDKLNVKFEKEALGVVLCMGPFNYPFNETLTTALPALLMGNSVIIKPPKIGVLFYDIISKALQKTLPKGVASVIYGDGPEVITPIMQSGKIDVLAFIGSSKVADILCKQHPKPHRLKLVLGLGAKNPAIVTQSADLIDAVNKVASGALKFNGQRCTALKNIFVHESIYDNFAKLLAFKIDALKVGQPWEQGVDITPLAEENKYQIFNALVSDAVSKGAKIINKDHGAQTSNLFHPVLIGDVTPEMRIFLEEQFGPVVPLIKYKTDKQVLDFLANSEFGQQASIFCNNLDDLNKTVSKLQRITARVNINQVCERGPDNFPFTARKSSGIGVLSIADALKEFSLESLVVS